MAETAPVHVMFIMIRDSVQNNDTVSCIPWVQLWRRTMLLLFTVDMALLDKDRAVSKDGTATSDTAPDFKTADKANVMMPDDNCDGERPAVEPNPEILMFSKTDEDISTTDTRNPNASGLDALKLLKDIEDPGTMSDDEEFRFCAEINDTVIDTPLAENVTLCTNPADMLVLFNDAYRNGNKDCDIDCVSSAVTVNSPFVLDVLLAIAASSRLDPVSLHFAENESIEAKNIVGDADGCKDGETVG